MASRRGGLGRGLGSLISEAQSESGYTSPDTTVSLNDIVPNPNQPRVHFDDELLDELAESIKAHGVLQPLLVRKHDGKYEIIAGERRYQASLRAGLEEVPVIVREVDDREMLELALIENLQRSDLNPIEEAKGYRQLIDANGLTQDALAQAVSKSRSAIANALRLLDLPDAVQDMLFEGKISAGHARAILSVPNDEDRVRLAERVVAEGLSVRATERLAPLFSVGEEPRPTRAVAPQSYKRAARALRRYFDVPVRVKSLRGKNKIEIEFTDEEDLSRLIHMMTSGREESHEHE